MNKQADPLPENCPHPTNPTPRTASFSLRPEAGAANFPLHSARRRAQAPPAVLASCSRRRAFPSGAPFAPCRARPSSGVPGHRRPRPLPASPCLPSSQRRRAARRSPLSSPHAATAARLRAPPRDGARARDCFLVDLLHLHRSGPGRPAPAASSPLRVPAAGASRRPAMAPPPLAPAEPSPYGQPPPSGAAVSALRAPLRLRRQDLPSLLLVAASAPPGATPAPRFPSTAPAPASCSAKYPQESCLPLRRPCCRTTFVNHFGCARVCPCAPFRCWAASEVVFTSRRSSIV